MGSALPYPDRPPQFDRLFIRAMADRCAANQIGPAGCWLLTVIVRQEDVNRYAGLVDFWTGQLMGLLGAGSEGTLKRVRNDCVRAGWLVYLPGKKGKAARYWVQIPGAKSGSKLWSEYGPESDQNTAQNPTRIRPTSIPTPIPDPLPVPAGEAPAVPPVDSKPPRKPKTRAARPRNPLFDSVAEVTGLDPSTARSHLGKVAAALAEADPPYTPDEVREFARRYLELCSYARGERTRPTPGEIEKYVGLVRTNKAAPAPIIRTAADISLIDAPTAPPMSPSPPRVR
ncbi:MAG: hypothetical protein JWO38_6278 [Gemmataceae bacterium]|nr:hypothetical protein [Gemmataceae bacterium]